MAEIAEPIHGLLAAEPLLALLPATEVDDDLEVLVLQDAAGAVLVHRLGLAVHQQLQLGAAVDGLEADARPLGHDRARGHALRVADGAQDPAPVGVAAVQGRLDQRGPGDGRRDAPRGLVVRGVLHPDGDEFRGALAVADNELREGLREGGQNVLHRGVIVRGGRANGGTARGSVGEEGDGVVGAGVAVDGDGVERARDGVREEGLQRRGLDRGVGAEDAQERGHVRVDHPGTLGHACEAVGPSGGGREGEGPGDQLGEGVRGADGAGGGEPGLMRGGEVGVREGDHVEDLLDWQSISTG